MGIYNLFHDSSKNDLKRMFEVYGQLQVLLTETDTMSVSLSSGYQHFVLI